MKHILFMVALTFTVSAQPLITTVTRGEYTSSPFGTLHGATTDTSKILGWRGGTYLDVGGTFDDDSIDALVCLLPILNGQDMKVDTLYQITYSDSLTRFGLQKTGEGGHLTVGTKYRFILGNADSIVVRRAGTGYAAQRVLADGDITITDSTGHLVYGDTTGVKVRAHVTTRAVRRIHSATAAAIGFTGYRVMVIFTSRTGKEGRYSFTMREY